MWFKSFTGSTDRSTSTTNQRRGWLVPATTWETRRPPGWATRWRHSALSAASSSASSPGSVHVLSISCNYVHPVFPWRSVVDPQFLLYSPTSFQESSSLKTCPSHLSLLSLTMHSNFRNPLFSLMSLFLTLLFHVIHNSLRCNLCWAAFNFFYARQLYGRYCWERVLAMAILPVRLSVTTRCRTKPGLDRDFGSSPYGSLGSLVSYEEIWCRWVGRFPSNEGIKQGYPLRNRYFTTIGSVSSTYPWRNHLSTRNACYTQ